MGNVDMTREPTFRHNARLPNWVYRYYCSSFGYFPCHGLYTSIIVERWCSWWCILCTRKCFPRMNSESYPGFPLIRKSPNTETLVTLSNPFETYSMEPIVRTVLGRNYGSFFGTSSCRLRQILKDVSVRKFTLLHCTFLYLSRKGSYITLIERLKRRNGDRSHHM